VTKIDTGVKSGQKLARASKTKNKKTCRLSRSNKRTNY